MKRSLKTGFALLLLISVSSSIVSAQQIRSVSDLREQIGTLERNVRGTENTSDVKASNLVLLAQKRALLRTSTQHQIASMRIYQSTYGYRFSARESKAVTGLIRSLELDLQSLARDSRSEDSLVSSQQERNHAQLTLANAEAAIPAQEDPTPAPTPATTPNPIVVKANEEKAVADAEKAAADARKAASDAETAAIAAKLAAQRAKLGLGPTDATSGPTPPAGNITAGEAPKFIETQILADTGARMASAELFRQMCGSDVAPVPDAVAALRDKPITGLVINNAVDKAAISRYRTTVGQLKFLHNHYAKLIKQSADERDDAQVEVAALPLLIPAATQIVKNAADLFNLFRTETDYKSQAVVIENRMIVSYLANRLLAANTAQCKVKAIYQPGVYPLSVPNEATGGGLLLAYKQLMDDVSKGDDEVNENIRKVALLNQSKDKLEADIAALEEQIIEAKKKKNAPRERGSRTPRTPAEPFDIPAAEAKIKKAKAFILKLDGRIARLNQAAASLTSFKTSLAGLFQILTAVDDSTKLPLLSVLTSAERLSDILARDGTYALDLVVKASGTNRTRRNMFFNTKLAHSGGVSIDANLYNKDDELVFGRIEDYYIEFTGSSDIRRRSGFKRLDELQR